MEKSDLLRYGLTDNLTEIQCEGDIEHKLWFQGESVFHVPRLQFLYKATKQYLHSRRAQIKHVKLRVQ